MISFAGIPPTPGFWGKLYIFQQAIADRPLGAGAGGDPDFDRLGLLLPEPRRRDVHAASDGEPADEAVRASDAGSVGDRAGGGRSGPPGILPQIFFQLSQSYALR
jgi:hypothetical protein